MDKPMFPKSNQLAEDALLELRNRLTEISINDIDIDIENKDNVITVYQILGEPNWDESVIVVTWNREILSKVLSGDRDLCSLTKNEWNAILNPSPSNNLVFKYFKKLHNAFKTNTLSNKTYDSAFIEINRILKEKWDAGSANKEVDK